MQTAVLVDTHYAHAEQIRRKLDWKAAGLQLFMEYSDINWLEKSGYMKTDILIIGYLTYCSVSDLLMATSVGSPGVTVIVVDQQAAPYPETLCANFCTMEQLTPEFLASILHRCNVPEGPAKPPVTDDRLSQTQAVPALQKLAELTASPAEFFLLRVLFRTAPTPPRPPHMGNYLAGVFEDLLMDWFWEESGNLCILVKDTPQMSILYSVRIIADMIHLLYKNLLDSGYLLYPILMSERTSQQHCLGSYEELLAAEESCRFCPDRVVLTMSQIRAARQEVNQPFLDEQVALFRQYLIAGQTLPAIHHLDLLYHQGIAPTLDPDVLFYCRRQMQLAFDLYALLEKIPSDKRLASHFHGTLEEEYEYIRTWIASHHAATGAQSELHPKIQTALEYMLQHYAEDLSQETMAQQLGLSAPYFSKLFKQDTGRGFVELLMDLRMEQAKCLFDTGHSNVQQVASQVGFHDPKYFSRVFRKKCGTSPAQYLAARNGKGPAGVQ